MESEATSRDWDAPRPNVDTINDLGGMFGGVIVHGETVAAIDVEFRNIRYALAFIEVMSDASWQWPCELLDTYTARNVAELMTRPVTVIIDKDL